MILGQVSYLDCIAFLIILTPQLLIHVGFIDTVIVALNALPFLLIQLPYQHIHERYFTKRRNRTPFVQQASPFQDVVIRCVRYAFAKIDASVGKVFFSKGVALPFFWFRRLRHGYLRSPIHWEEVNRPSFKGLWMVMDPSKKPDIVVYYCHGGGFSMGSSYFYLEFLLAWISLLKDSGYKNPGLFALEYTLVPEAQYPHQIRETQKGYEHVLSIIGDSSKICVGGDSAGATLMLSLVLHMTEDPKERPRLPGLGIIISPWAVIISPKNTDTPSDYLNADSLHLYGSQYVGKKASVDDPLISPGKCKDLSWWQRAAPSEGWYFLFGSEEVFGPETRDLVGVLRKSGTDVAVHEEKGWIHAWPVVKLFLCDGQDARQSGLRSIVKYTRERIQ